MMFCQKCESRIKLIFFYTILIKSRDNSNNMKKFILFILICAIFLSIVIVTGCTTNQKASTNSTSLTTPKTKIIPFQTFRLGDSVTNDKVRITVNSVQYGDRKDFFDFNYNEYTVDITFVNNDTTEIAYISPYSSFSVMDVDGFEYKVEGYPIIEKQLSTDATLQILPGETRRGNIFFKIPKTSKHLLLKYNFGEGQIAKILIHP